MIYSNKAVELVKHFELFYPKAYKCPAGVWTIGYGSTRYKDGRPVHEGETITLQDAVDLMTWELDGVVKAIAETIFTELHQHQVDALCCWVYNVGIGAFKSSTLLFSIHSGDLAAVPEQLLRWVKADGRRLPGLLRRRLAEASMFCGFDWTVFKGEIQL